MSNWMRKQACRVMSALNPEDVFLANGEAALGNWWDAHSFIPGLDTNSISPRSFISIPSSSERLTDEETFEILSEGFTLPLPPPKFPVPENFSTAEALRLADEIIESTSAILSNIARRPPFSKDFDPCPVDITQERQQKEKKQVPSVMTVTVEVHHRSFKGAAPQCQTSTEDPAAVVERNTKDPIDPMVLKIKTDEEIQLKAEVASTGSGGSSLGSVAAAPGPPLCKTVGHMDDPKFALMKLSKSGRIWLSPRSDDILIVKEDGRIVLPPSARLKYMPNGKSYQRQLKQRMGKFYDRLFSKKEAKSKAFEWGTCSLDRRSTLQCKSRKTVQGSRSDNIVCGITSSGSKISV